MATGSSASRTSFTKFRVTNQRVELWRVVNPTLELIQWGDTTPNNNATVTLTDADAQTSPNGSTAAWLLGGNRSQTINGVINFSNKIDGGAGNDTINGGELIDYLYGNTGNDQLNGGDGADRLSGGAGRDRLSGGSDNDFLFGDNDDDSLVGGDGSDTIYAGEGNDTIIGDGSFRFAGNDIIFGGNGNDSASGGNGNDYLAGEAGNDTLDGNAGNDTIVGGLGSDVLTGAAGNDAFVFRLGDSKQGATIFTDTITDFARGTDKIWLDWANYETSVTTRNPLNVTVADGLNGGTDLSFDFVGNGVGTDYRINLSNIRASSLGTGSTLQKNLNEMFILYDQRAVSYPPAAPAMI
jgi:Ca2+-binding RTX toxin-like protein